MNTGGFSEQNFHDGDTTIAGNLTVSGQIFANTGNNSSEYLDSGDYKTTITPGGIAWNTLTLTPGTSARYAKNGNIVQFYVTLRGNIKANQPSAVFTLTVPAFDLFGVVPLPFATVSSTFILSDGSVFNVFSNTLSTTSNISSIALLYNRSSGSNITTSIDFDITLTYKLTGEDIPASVLVSGGGGSGGDVQNPMINNLNGGGFNLTNFGDISATTFNGGDILTNPPTVDLNMAGFNIYNVNGLEVEIMSNFIDGAPIGVASNIDMKGNNILAVSALSATDIVNDTIFLKRIIKNSLLSVDEIQVEKIKMLENINMDNNSIDNVNVLTTNAITSDQVSIDINRSIDFKSTSSLIGCIDIRTNSIGLNDAKEITINGDVSMSGNNISGCSDIRTNSIGLNGAPAITINGNMNMAGNTVFGAQDILTTKIEAEILDISSKLELFGTGVIENALSTQTTELKVSNIKSDTVGVPTAPVNFLNHIEMNNYSIFNLGNLNTTSINISSSLDVPIINTIKYIRNLGDITSFNFSGVYVVCGIITIPSATTFTTSDDTVFIGYDREETGFIFNNPSLDAGFCLTSTSHNISFINMRISNISPSRSLFSFNDPPKLKKITMLNSLFINCKNQSVVLITGYDLVDINQTVFELCFPTADHLTISECDKIQISNCTLYKSIGNFGSTPGTAPLILLAGVCGLVNINGTCINTQAAQDGIKIDNSFNVTRAMIGGNTLQSTLSTGQLLNYNANIHPNLLVSDNAGVRDNRSILSAQSFGNITYTPTVLNVYQPINFGLGFTVLTTFGFSAGVEPFSFLYNRTQPIDVVISANFTSDHDTGGIDVLRVALFKNNNIVSFAESESEAKIAVPISYNAITPINFNDVLIFKCLNLTAGTSPLGYRCTSFNGTLSEA
jgi:hypothetical protein